MSIYSDMILYEVNILYIGYIVKVDVCSCGVLTTLRHRAQKTHPPQAQKTAPEKNRRPKKSRRKKNLDRMYKYLDNTLHLCYNVLTEKGRTICHLI